MKKQSYSFWGHKTSLIFNTDFSPTNSTFPQYSAFQSCLRRLTFAWGESIKLNYESRTRGLSQGALQEAKQRWNGCGSTGGSRWRSLEAGMSWHFLSWVTSKGFSVPPVWDRKSMNSQFSAPAPQGAVYRITGASSRPTSMPSCPGWRLYVLIKAQPGWWGTVRAPAPHSPAPIWAAVKAQGSMKTLGVLKTSFERD